MAFSDVSGQERAKRFLVRIARSGHIPHALLFSGLAGIGKEACALEFAKLVNCSSPTPTDNCGHCSSCRKITTGSSPDLVRVSRDGAFIKLDQVRELKDRVRFRPYENRWRVIIIQDAQHLREEAGNALLKILEEPPAGNIFILTALEPQMLLPTIVSRCCHIRLQPLEARIVEERLITDHGVAPEKARGIAELCEGSLERALWYTEKNRFARWEFLKTVINKLESTTVSGFFSLAAEWVQGSEDFEHDLEWFRLWLRELTTACFVDTSVRAPGTLVEPGDALCRIRPEDLFELYDHIEKALQHLRLNANKLLVAEGVCFAIREKLYGQSDWNPLPQGR